MLTVLSRAAPLSEKCKRCELIENRQPQASLATVEYRQQQHYPVIADSPSASSAIIAPSISLSPSPSPSSSSSSREEDSSVIMTCVAPKTSLPTSPYSSTILSGTSGKNNGHLLTDARIAAAASCGGSRAVLWTVTGDLDGTLLPGCDSSVTPLFLYSPSLTSCCSCDLVTTLIPLTPPSPSPSTTTETLKWCEARRIGSEPVELKAASFTDLRDDEEDDVFTLTAGGDADDSWSTSDELEDSFEEEELWLEGWEEFVIPSREIIITSILSHNCVETVFNGYWHGNVQVMSREARNREDIRCFCQEVTALNKIRHESIQLFMGITVDMGGGHLGLVMSPLKGESLQTRLHVHGHQFSMTSKFKIVKQICEGMEYLHSRGISHGKLSTRNIFIHNRVCIKFRPQVCLPRAVTCEDLISLPPEDIRALSSHRGNLVLPNSPSLKPDIFAFGTLVYELVLLSKPFKNVARECVIWRVGSGNLHPLSLLPRDRLRGVIQRCWHLSPDSRPTFKAILSEVEQNVPVFSPQKRGNGLQRSLSLPSVLTDPPSPTIIY